MFVLKMLKLGIMINRSIFIIYMSYYKKNMWKKTHEMFLKFSH